MPSPYSWQFVDSYTDLRDVIRTKLVEAGWTEVITGYYKSAAAGHDDKYAYVHVYDDGASKTKVSVATLMNEADTDLHFSISKDVYFSGRRLWHFWMYDKWFYAFADESGQTDRDFVPAEVSG
jgi:hypothetical protein